MCLNWFLPRFSHHRTPGFGHNDAVAQVLNAKRFPGIGRLPTLDVSSMPTEGRMDNRWDSDIRRPASQGSVRNSSGSGLMDEQLKHLPVKIIEDGSEQVCCICLEKLAAGTVVIALGCPHVQH